jgi:hypothetical protein
MFSIAAAFALLVIFIVQHQKVCGEKQRVEGELVLEQHATLGIVVTLGGRSSVYMLDTGCTYR